MIDIIFVFTILAWFMLVIAMWKGDKWMGFIAGIFLLIIGMFGLIYGVQDVNNELTRVYGLVHIAIGFLISLMAGMEVIEDVESESTN